MAGNKFRNFRNKEEETKEKADEDINIERDSNIILTIDYGILTKPKDDPKYHSKYILKKGTLAKVIDNNVVSNNIPFLKLFMPNESIFGYIPFKDKLGNNIIEPYDFFKNNKEDKKKIKPNISTYGSTELGKAKLANDENNQKSQEDIKCLKNSKELELKFIKLLVNDIQNEQENTNESTEISNISQPEVDLSQNNKDDPFDLNNSIKKPEPKVMPIVNRIDISNLKDQFCPLSKNYGYNKENNFSQDLIDNMKDYLVNCYLMKKELNNNKQAMKPIKKEKYTLEPKYDKGYQLIYRPLDFPFGKKIYNKYYAGHIFVRYYDKKKGIDIIIESKASFISFGLKNEIIFRNFKKEELDIFEILEEEELKGERNYYEEVKKILNNRYKKKNKCIRGDYSVDNNCCFHTVEEVLFLFGKPGNTVNKIHKEYIKPLSDKTKDVIEKSFIINFKFGC